MSTEVVLPDDSTYVVPTLLPEWTEEDQDVAAEEHGVRYPNGTVVYKRREFHRDEADLRRRPRT